MNVSGLGVGRVPAAAGSISAVGRKRRWVSAFMPMVRAPVGVLTVCTTSNVTGLFGGDGQGAVSSAGEGQACACCGGVHARADGKRGLDLAGFIVHDDQPLRVAAADEEAVAGWIDRHADRLTGGRDRPARDDRARLEVYDGHDILVFKIDEDLAAAVGGEKLRLAAQLDGGDFAVCRVDVRGEGHERAAVAGDGEDAVELGVVDDAVGVGHGGELPRTA